MYSLLIDTHSEEINIILYKDGKLYFNNNEIFNNQSQIIVKRISELLTKANINYEDLSEIIVVNGPGSFTGVRIAVTIAKTMAYCLNIPIKTISSLTVKAISSNTNSNIFVSIPDSKGFFIGEYDNNLNMLRDYFYLNKNEYNDYIKDNEIIDVKNIDWNAVYQKNLFKEEDCYNVKPIYIKKIGVEND